jgi:hypothetical protein
MWEAKFRLGMKMAYLGSYASKQEAGVVWDAASVWRSMKAPGKLVLAANYVACLPLASTDLHWRLMQLQSPTA